MTQSDLTQIKKVRKILLELWSNGYKRGLRGTNAFSKQLPMVDDTTQQIYEICTGIVVDFDISKIIGE